jgi:hypothetical protein
MNRLNVPVGPIHMVLTDSIAQKLYEKKKRYPYLPSPEAMLGDLQEMNMHGGIPALVNKRRDGAEQLLLYTSSYYLALYDSPHHDGYTIGHLDTLNLQEHERLSRGVLRIHAQGWNLHQELRDIPPGNQNFWGAISAAWQHFERLRQQRSPEETQEDLTHAQEHYLAVLEDLLEVTHQLEQDKSNLNAGIPYKKVEAAGEVRDAPRDIYIFRLADIPQLNEKSMLRVKGEGLSDLRGRVLELEGLKLTLKFESLVDSRRIPKQGVLEPIVSPVIYKKQRQALDTLKAREAKNTSLLRVLVDHTYLPYQPARILQENDDELKKLTPEQFEAFRRALTVPDILMVLGPPGTGKTRTITEIARYCGYKQQRVLVTSGTHKAVDNVLERMPPDLIVIRVGHENNVSEKMREKMIDAQAQKLQEVLRKNTENAAYGFGRLLSSKDEIDTIVHQLTQGQAYLANKEAHLNLLYQQRNTSEARITGPFKQKYDELNANLQPLLKKVAQLQNRVNVWSSRRANNEKLSHLPVLGWIFMIILNYSISRLAKNQQTIQEKNDETRAIQQEMNRQYQAGQLALATDSEYQQCNQQIHQLATVCEKVWEELVKIAEKLQAILAGILPIQLELAPKGSATFQRYLSSFNAIREPLERKARLLQEWRAELGKPTDQLYPELLRYADVVGATCIGTATAKGLEAVDFDLAIVDEAGQICLHDLLVPLVRARRAILVGDHNQLPPFVDSEVQNWLRGASAQKQSLAEIMEDEEELQLMADLLTKSAFENLFTKQADSSHLVRFTMQGRMPRTIADFASRHFYGNQLGTFSDEKMQHTVDSDPLFRYPLTVIDTSNAPADIRWERQQRSLESLGETGYTNIVEARLIAELAELYQRSGREWVIIVPYRAQARLVIEELEKRIEVHDFSLAERVATVDSFQGGERKKVIYSFTRSNERGKIGFLKELRRLNVAMTRAQQHLILIGNFSTLINADDPRFRFVLSDLYTYAQQRGEVLTYESCRKRLRGVLEGRTVR